MWPSGPLMSCGATTHQNRRSSASALPRFGSGFSTLLAGICCWLSTLALWHLATSLSFRLLVTKGTYGASQSHLPSWPSIWSSLATYRGSCGQSHREIKILETVQKPKQLDWTTSWAVSGLSCQLEDGSWLLQVPRAGQQYRCHP